MLNQKTSIYCVIGDPVKHSLSPLMHNASFKSLGLNAAYAKFHVKKEELNQTNGCIENWNCTEWSGCIGNERTRNCNDLNDCGTTVNKMIEIESCECVEEWECTNWSKCYEGDKVRVCSDQF